jgi:hypothetical protein
MAYQFDDTQLYPIDDIYPGWQDIRHQFNRVRAA